MAPIADGAIQMEWRGPDRAVEVEIGPDGMIGYLIEGGRAPHVRFANGEGISQEETLGLIARVIAP